MIFCYTHTHTPILIKATTYILFLKRTWFFVENVGGIRACLQIDKTPEKQNKKTLFLLR